jgi:hypothetical protein
MWAVICLSMAIPVWVGTYKTLPTEAKLIHYHNAQNDLLKEDIKRLTEKADSNPGPWNNFGNETVERVKEKMKAGNEKAENELARLPSERRERITWSFGIWAGFSVSLYITGWLTGWIYRGFRSKKTNQGVRP